MQWRQFGGLVLFWMVLGSLCAQPIETGFYSSDNGLSDRTVEDILMGPDGFLWVATTNGLHRFDGYDFLAFSNSTENPPERRLAAGNINRLHLSHDNRIVVFYQQKNYVFDILDPFTHQVERVDVGLSKNIQGRPVNVSIDKKGQVFVVTADSARTNIYRYQDKTFSLVFRLYDDLHQPLQLLHLSDGRFLMHSHNRGFQVYEASGRRLYSLSLDSLPQGRREGSTLDIMYEQTSRLIWVSYSNLPGLWCWDGHSRTLKACPGLAQDVHYTDLWPDKSGNVLLNQSEPIGNYPRTLQLFMLKPNGQVLPFSQLIPLTGGFVLAAAGQDFSRSVFLGLDTGLKIIRNTYSNIKTYLREDINIDERGKVMRGITADDRGRIYFARERSCWYVLDPQTEKLDTLYLYDELSGNRIDFNCCNQLHYDQAGHIWAITCENATDGGGQLLRYDVNTHKTSVYRYNYRFTTMAADRHGGLWLGINHKEDQGGLVYFDPNGPPVFKAFTIGGLNPLKGALPRFILEARDGALWVGTELGLFYIDARKPHKYRVYRRDIEDGVVRNNEVSLALSDNIIYVLHESPTGQLFIGTKNGLDIFDPGTGKIVSYNERDGLASNTICGILPDPKGNYWISTFNGISYFDVAKKSFLRYFRSDGFSHSEFNRFSFYRAANGRFYFGGVNGVNAFYSKDLLFNQEQPRVALTSLTRYNGWDDSLYVETALLNKKELVLSAFDEYFNLTFSLPDFTQPSLNRYRYQLVGTDKDWVYLNGQHSLRYHGLDAGKHILRIQGAGPNGNWNENILELTIYAKQVFYKRVWFFLLCSILASSFIYWWLQLRLNQRLSDERLRTKLSSDLHDEVSGLLAGIAMQSDLLHSQTQDQNLQQKLQRIGEASRKAMSKMSDVIWSIDSRRDKVGDLITRMEEHADEVLLPINIQYDITLEKLDKQMILPANIRQDLYFIYKEAINNVAKHAQANQVSISLRNLPQQFELKIQDNGKGDDPAQGNGRRGQGLSNLHMRAQRLNAQLDIQTTPGYTILLRMKKLV